RPFKNGDQIRTSSYQGIVEAVNFRSTILIGLVTSQMSFKSWCGSNHRGLLSIARCVRRSPSGCTVSLHVMESECPIRSRPCGLKTHDLTALNAPSEGVHTG